MNMIPPQGIGAVSLISDGIVQISWKKSDSWWTLNQMRLWQWELLHQCSSCVVNFVQIFSDNDYMLCSHFRADFWKRNNETMAKVDNAGTKQLLTAFIWHLGKYLTTLDSIHSRRLLTEFIWFRGLHARLGHKWMFQHATFCFVESNLCEGLGHTQFLVLPTSDLWLWISDPGTKFRIRVVSEMLRGGLAWCRDCSSTRGFKCVFQMLDLLRFY